MRLTVLYYVTQTTNMICNILQKSQLISTQYTVGLVIADIDEMLFHKPYILHWDKSKFRFYIEWSQWNILKWFYELNTLGVMTFISTVWCLWVDANVTSLLMCFFSKYSLLVVSFVAMIRKQLGCCDGRRILSVIFNAYNMVWKHLHI